MQVYVHHELFLFTLHFVVDTSNIIIVLVSSTSSMIISIDSRSYGGDEEQAIQQIRE